MLVGNGADLAASAQSFDAGTSANLAAEQDSLLPPEVVPLDPAAANKLVQSQAQSRAAQMSTPELQPDPMSGMQTAQDARKSTYDQLLGQSQTTPLNSSNQFGASQGGQGFNNQPGSFGTQIANASPGTAQAGQSNWVQPGSAGSQTLSGSVKAAPQKQDIRRGGLSNAVSAVAGLGTGLFLGSLVSRSLYTNPIGLGMFGLGATGFGVRNGFRF